MAIEENAKLMVDKVMKKAEKEAANVIKIAEMARKRNLRPYQEKAEKIKEKRITEGKKRLEILYHSKKSNIEMKSKFSLLREKERFEESIKKELVKKFQSWLLSDEYRMFLMKTCKVFSKQMDRNGSVVHVNKNDMEIMEKILKEMNLKDKTIVEKAIQGGIILENKESHFYYDMSLDSLFDDWFDKNKNNYFGSNE